MKLSQFLLAKAPPADTQFSGWDSVSIVLTDDKGITPVHQDFLNKNSSTDVITFCYDPVPGEDLPSGEIIVNIQRAAEEGEQRDGANFELALYVAHGCDHLSGYDDHSDDGYNTMREREMCWLEEAKAQGLIDGLIEHE